MSRTADVVICGAGIMGVAAACLLKKAGVRDILLVDERPPLSLTSDRSTECYRNWWPDAAMMALMNRSIDLMEELAEESGNSFHMNRRGYLYVTGEESKVPALIERSKRTSSLGAGPLRTHQADGRSNYQRAPAEGFKDQPTGADLLLGNETIRKHYPYLTGNATAALHVRRAGWLSAQQLGMQLLETGRRQGVQSERARVESIDVEKGRVCTVRLGNGETIQTANFVNAAGPYLKSVGALLGLDLPVYTELHLKAALNDPLQVVPRDAPLLIWDDVQSLPWSADERESLANDDETHWLTGQFPAGAHTRPEGSGESRNILMLWEYKTKVMEPIWPLPLDEQFPEIALHGLAAMLPRMREYFNKMPRPKVDGGYYTKTRENKPLIGPMGIEGAFMAGAGSGYGIMSACGAADLLAKYITGENLPAYAASFELSRYESPEYMKLNQEWQDSGQL
jgi:glycine/D-amino acid oxidase-like deaminating enzyme